MRLNLLNLTTVVKDAIDRNRVLALNPRYGVASSVNENTFRYAKQGEVSNVLLVQKVSLNDLFDKVPQDIRGLDFSKDLTVNTQDIADLTNLNADQAEPLIDDFPNEQADVADPLGQLFCNWKRLVGIQGLTRNEVDLGSLDGYLIVTARNATLYRGSVRVRYQ